MNQIIKTILTLLMILNFACIQPGKNKDDLRNLFLLALFQKNGISLVVDPGQSQFLSNRQRSLISIPAELQNPSYSLNSISAKDFAFSMTTMLVWKSPSLGGVPHGSETIQNADKIIWDIGLSRYGAEARGKMAFRFLPGDLMDTIYGTRGANETDDSHRFYSIEKDWQNSSYDRLGLVITDMTLEFESAKLSRPFLKVAKFIVSEINNFGGIQYIDDAQYTKDLQIRIRNSIELPSSEELVASNSPCLDAYQIVLPSERNHELVACGLAKSFRTKVRENTGNNAPTVAALELFYEELYARNLITSVEKNDKILDMYATSDVEDPPHVGSIKTLYPNLMSQYSSNAWQNERLLVLPMPEGERTNLTLVVSGENTLMYHANSIDASYEPIDNPKYQFNQIGGKEIRDYKFDLDWAVAQGIDPSSWPMTPSNGNQIDPANGKNFGYFLPKISVK